ncbi:hypothetical protein AB833_00055 [Chromatiales bacterium (ex Bugula neritina AB1)]|nr:hypothetical protein AB833_00055 [Chromatiales bacterium (ex Bugula neritina AB1)]
MRYRVNCVAKNVRKSFRDTLQCGSCVASKNAHRGNGSNGEMGGAAVDPGVLIMGERVLFQLIACPFASGFYTHLKLWQQFLC